MTAATTGGEVRETFWNGEPTPCERGTIELPDGEFAQVVKVTYRGQEFYLDDMHTDSLAYGWDKVTFGKGSPRYGHRELTGRSFIPLPTWQELIDRSKGAPR